MPFLIPSRPQKRRILCRNGWHAPMSEILEPTERHWEILSGLLTTSQAHGPLVMDAHLAALAIEHGATLCTSDRDSPGFPIQWQNPLIPPQKR